MVLSNCQRATGHGSLAILGAQDCRGPRGRRWGRRGIGEKYGTIRGVSGPLVVAVVVIKLAIFEMGAKSDEWPR